MGSNTRGSSEAHTVLSIRWSESMHQIKEEEKLWQICVFNFDWVDRTAYMSRTHTHTHFHAWQGNVQQFPFSIYFTDVR